MIIVLIELLHVDHLEDITNKEYGNYLQKFPVTNGYKLILINSHMSAYDKGGKMRVKQLKLLNSVMESEYKKGNYVIVGGDFNRNGGNLGESGSVSFMFNRKGYIAISREDLDVDEDTMELAAIEAGADDVQTSDEVFEIYTDPKDFDSVRDALQKDYDLDTAELTMVPTTTTEVPANKVEQLQRLIDKLEDEDDVSEVFTTAEFPEED